MSKEVLDTIFSGVSAAASALGIGLAFYAAFFTSLPEKIISELNSDVQLAKAEKASLHSQLQSLERDKQRLKSETEELSLEVNTLQSQNSLLVDQYHVLEGDRASLKTELERYEKAAAEAKLLARTRGLNSIIGLFLSDFISLEGFAKRGTQILEGIDWYEKQPSLRLESKEVFFWQVADEKKRIKIELESAKKKHSKWFSDSRAWLSIARLLDLYGGPSSNDRKSNESIAEFAVRYFYENSSEQVTLAQLIERAIKLAEDMQHDKDLYMALKELTRRFIADNHAVAHLNLKPVVSQGMTPEEVQVRCKKALLQIMELKQTALAFQASLNTKFGIETTYPSTEQVDMYQYFK